MLKVRKGGTHAKGQGRGEAAIEPVMLEQGQDQKCGLISIKASFCPRTTPQVNKGVTESGEQ